MGNIIALIAPYSQISQQIPPRSTFEPKRDIPDLTKKVVVITGANSGIGYQTAKELIRKNAKVYFACRDTQKAKEAVDTIRRELRDEWTGTFNTTFGEGVVLELDLSDLESVKRASAVVLSKEDSVDVLINNAAVMLPPFDLLTKQGYDLQFGTNVLGHYYFTMLLMPALERSTIYHKEKARVINLSSSGHIFPPGKIGIDWQVLKGGEERDKAIKKLGIFKDWKLYGISKMGTVLMTYFFARHYGDKIVSCSMNPGGTKTNLQRHLPPISRAMMNTVLYSPAYGAYTTLFAATVVPANDINGKFFQPWARFGRADPRASNVEVQDQLKQWLEEQITEFEKSG